MTELQRNIIDTVEAARILGVSRQWVATLIRLGQLKAQKVGRNWVLNREDVEQYKARANKRNGD